MTQLKKGGQVKFKNHFYILYVTELTFYRIFSLTYDCQGRNLSDNWGGGGGVIPDGFLLKLTQKKNSKEIRRAEHEYMNKHTHPPPPSN